MFKIDEPTTFIQEIKKSRFRAIAAPVRDEADAKAFLKEFGDPQANHNCWAWRTGQTYRFSDDGEPSGTAGKPILQAIDGQEIDGAIVVVTRWFGGILLGSGGLIRAYGGTAAACLRSAEKSVLIAMKSFKLDCGFADLALIEARLNAVVSARIRSKEFNETGARLMIELPELSAAATISMISDITSGRSVLSEID